MKKLINLIALVMLVSANVLTPLSYAQQTQEPNLPEISVETGDVDLEQLNEVTDLGEGENQSLDVLEGEENGHEKENQDFPENLNEENKISDNLKWRDVQILDKLEESDDQQEGEKQSLTETPTQIDVPEKSIQTEIQEDEVSEDSIMMYEEKNIKAQAEPKKVTITYNLNGGYWTEDKTTDAKEVVFTLDANNMVSTTDRKTPSKSDSCEENGEMKKCMFDGWYLENGARWTGYATSGLTVYAHWLPFEDLIVTTGGVTFTIMDRNIGAIVADVTNTDSYGYHFQWGNNYGFKRYRNGEYKFPNGEKAIWVKSTDRTGYISTYYKGIWVAENPWNDGAIPKDNLWGGSETSNSDTDRQGPCPDGYHVPDTLEWKAVGSLLKAGDSGYIVRDTLNLPFAGYRDNGQFVYNMGSIGRYWSSTSRDVSNAYYLYFKSPSISIPNNWQSYYSRSHGFSVRCFQNSSPQILTFLVGGGELDTSITSTARWWEEGENLPVPTKDGSVFLGWYTSSSYDADTKVETNVITSDGPVTLYAKWEDCGQGYKVVNNTCIDENAGIFYEDGYIKITDGKDSVYMKDRNQGATISEKQKKMIEELDEELCNLYGCDTDDYNTVLGQKTEELLGIRFDSYDEMMNYSNSIGNYYYRGNNNGVSYLDFEIENDIIVNKDDLISKGFDGGNIGNEEGSGWIEGNNNNPCKVDSGEYLPTPDDWNRLLGIRGNLNGYEVEELPFPFYDNVNFNGISGNIIYDFMADIIMYPGPYIFYENEMLLSSPGFLISWNGQNKDGEVGITLMGMMNLLGTAHANPENVDEDLVDEINSVAMPVRCFIRPQFEVSFEVNGGTSVDTQKVFSGDNAEEPETQKENAEFLGWYKADGTKFDFTTHITSDITLYAKWQEKKSNNGYSGGGGGGGTTKPDTQKEEQKPADTSEQDSQPDGQDLVEPQKDKNTPMDSSDQVPQTDNANTQDSSTLSQNDPKTYSPEFQQAYKFAHSYGITTKNSVENAQMNSPLTRIQMAKMLSQYAINVLGKEPDVSKGVIRFSDVTNKMNKEYDNGVTLAYQLGIMGQNMKNNKFRPDDEVTRAEFATALSRMIFNTSDGEFKATSKYYIHHMEKLVREGIITKDDPNMKELRGYVMIMLMRSSK